MTLDDARPVIDLVARAGSGIEVRPHGWPSSWAAWVSVETGCFEPTVRIFMASCGPGGRRELRRRTP
jgi:hypothetical protein